MIFLMFTAPCKATRKTPRDLSSFYSWTLTTSASRFTPLLIYGRPHYRNTLELSLFLPGWYSVHTVLFPSVPPPNPLTSDCVCYSSGSTGSSVRMADCGNTWSPNVIPPQEFHQSNAGNTQVNADKVSVMCWLYAGEGTWRNTSKWVLTPHTWTDAYPGCQQHRGHWG